jgi:hypothetical protein
MPTNPCDTTGYDLIRESALLVCAIEEENGEMSPFEPMLDDLLARVNDKVKACLYVAWKMESEEKELRSLEVKIAKRRRAIQGERARVLERVQDMRHAAEELGEDFKVKNAEYSVYLRKSQAVDVDEDLSNVDVRFLIEQEPKVDKTKAKELLKKGEKIAGLTLKTNTSLQWRLF